MLAADSNARQEQLKQCLYRLASQSFDSSETQSVVEELKNLYTGGFRHSYAEFFPIIVEMSKDCNAYSTDILALHLTEISQFIEKDFVVGDREYTRLYRPVLKLCDHLNLEIGRFSHYAVSENKIRDLSSSVESATEEINNSKLLLAAATRKAASLQTEIIAVLSIFSAVVLAFMGGMSFSNGVLESISKASVYKVGFISLICGMVVFNTIFGLMYLVSKITGRNIYARCRTDDCTCADGVSPKCSTLLRLAKRLPYVFWLNCTFISLILLLIVAWMFDFHHIVHGLRSFLFNT